MKNIYGTTPIKIQQQPGYEPYVGAGGKGSGGAKGGGDVWRTVAALKRTSRVRRANPQAYEKRCGIDPETGERMKWQEHVLSLMGKGSKKIEQKARAKQISKQRVRIGWVLLCLSAACFAL